MDRTHEIALYQQDSKGEIILYQPDDSLKLEVRLDNETVWLAQIQIAKLFGVDRSVITKHLQNIFKTGELDENSIYAIFAHMGTLGKQRYCLTALTTVFFSLTMMCTISAHHLKTWEKNGLPSQKWDLTQICCCSILSNRDMII